MQNLPLFWRAWLLVLCLLVVVSDWKKRSIPGLLALLLLLTSGLRGITDIAASDNCFHYFRQFILSCGLVLLPLISCSVLLRLMKQSWGLGTGDYLFCALLVFYMPTIQIWFLEILAGLLSVTYLFLAKYFAQKSLPFAHQAQHPVDHPAAGSTPLAEAHPSSNNKQGAPFLSFMGLGVAVFLCFQ